mgnify:CR=1 FL=1
MRQLDLKSRLFQHHCSYLVYSPLFDSLPAPVREQVVDRLTRILRGVDNSEDFARLIPNQRRTLLEILNDTKPGLQPVLD